MVVNDIIKRNFIRNGVKLWLIEHHYTFTVREVIFFHNESKNESFFVRIEQRSYFFQDVPSRVKYSRMTGNNTMFTVSDSLI